MLQSILYDNKPRTWLLLTFGDKRKYSGNRGYDDELSKVYEYDNFVPNHRQISEGDIVLLRSKIQLLGVAKIEEIRSRKGEKELLRCPSCGKTQLDKRKRKEYEFRCYRCGHEFNTPIKETVARNIFTAHFGDTFVLAEGAVNLEVLRKACPKYNGQLAMQLIEIQKIEATLLENAPAVATLLHQNNALDYLVSDDAEENGNEDISKSNTYSPITNDRRQLVMRQIRERRGQSKFRQALRLRYGDRCMITGCKLIDVVEAAHISYYRGSEDNHPDNGLLLRADLHTLFDLDLLGIHPESLQVQFHPKVIAAGYKKLDGKMLICSEIKPSKEALNSRWERFLKRLQSKE